ncbi:hypothetical protein D3OALGA1CA_265 [Olavius algarvensis associated proteobacterium Delta 3]|nr:hypothetical protein D3OALGA1CA_265 [Olavius algarvensis associated proteobacterium Delta 3]CAB5098496.1 hypothetical protein D3OALGB2SA_1680 [Olavius algarvensis associated proteobacterium Delta 3]
MNKHLSRQEIELLTTEEIRLNQAHTSYCKSIWLYAWIAPLILCMITMLASNIDKLHIAFVWIGIGVVMNIGLCIENRLSTKKQTAHIKKAIAENSRSGVEFLLRDSSAGIEKITMEDIENIESQLKIVLPEFFKSTLTCYPFPKGSIAEEFLLPHSPSLIISNNGPSLTQHIDVACENPFFVGGDGGEELYYIDLNSSTGEVFVYSMETKTSQVHSESWRAYLDHISGSILALGNDKP